MRKQKEGKEEEKGERKDGRKEESRIQLLKEKYKSQL
jgi:hypothetical protein